MVGLSRSNHINVIVGRVYGMLQNLCAAIDSNRFAIRIQLAKTYLIPVLFYGSEIFNLAYNNIARYEFIKGCRDCISQFSCFIVSYI